MHLCPNIQVTGIATQGLTLEGMHKHLILRKTQLPIRTKLICFEVNEIFFITFGKEVLEAVGLYKTRTFNP